VGAVGHGGERWRRSSKARPLGPVRVNAPRSRYVPRWRAFPPLTWEAWGERRGTFRPKTSHSVLLLLERLMWEPQAFLPRRVIRPAPLALLLLKDKNIPAPHGSAWAFGLPLAKEKNIPGAVFPSGCAGLALALKGNMPAGSARLEPGGEGGMILSLAR